MRSTIIDITNDIIIPKRGATTINMTIFRTPANMTESNPFPATAAPISPPTRVCEELEGRPSHQVIRFQVIAAIIADEINIKEMISGLITPLPIVVATFKGKIRNARKLKTAASITADNGERTLVETTVAIEFAES
jgi:hypothetical protein